MAPRAVAAMKAAQNRRLRDHGHPVRWRTTETASYLGACRNCGAEVECDEYGVHWRGGILSASFLKFPGVNVIRRCPGGR